MSLDPEILRTIHPGQFYDRFLSENIRPDGRSLLKCRKTSVTLGSIRTANGSCSAKIGNTTMLCGITAEITQPDILQPNHGFIEINVNLSPLCSTSFVIGKPGEISVSIGSRIQHIMKNAIDMTQLCIKSGEIVWILYCDIVCLNYDGNAFDATLLAVHGALSDLQLPHPIVDEKNGRVSVNTNVSTRLQEMELPLSLTLTSINNHLMCDPTGEEEQLGDGIITISMTSDGNIQSVYKPGGSSLTSAILQHSISLTRSRQQSLRLLIKKQRDRSAFS